jgi:hypothetical protein
MATSCTLPTIPISCTALWLRQNRRHIVVMPSSFRRFIVGLFQPRDMVPICLSFQTPALKSCGETMAIVCPPYQEYRIGSVSG